MSNENNENNEKNVQLTEAEAQIVNKLVGTENLFVILSKRTVMPFVVCDPETFDDEVLVYEKPEDAHNALKRLTEERNPVDVGLIAQKDRLNFFANMCTMGVNCIALNEYTENVEKVQLDRMVRTPKGITPDGQPWIENSALHLTAIYFMQAVARSATKEATQELLEMREEIVAHYSKGNFIILLNDKGQLPIMKYPNGDAYQPIFTDMFEASKFRVEGTTTRAAIQATKIPAILSPEAKGVVVNPVGVGLQIPIIRQAPQQAHPQQMQPQQVPPQPTNQPAPQPQSQPAPSLTHMMAQELEEGL